MKHQESCFFALTQCEHGCGEKMLRIEAEGHLDSCPEKKSVCENCEFTAKINKEGEKARYDSHECIKELKAKLKFVKDETEALQKNF